MLTNNKITLDQDPEYSKKSKRWIWLGGACFLVVGAMVTIPRLLPEFSSPQETTEVNAVSVETITLQPASGYDITRRYTGEITAQRSSELGLERGGELTEVLVEEGDRVSQGDPLAKLDTQNLQAQRKQLQARRDRAIAQLEKLETGTREEKIQAAKARVRNLEKELDLKQVQRSRREFLYQEGAISQEQRDEFVTQAEALTARLEEAESQLQELRNGTRQEDITAQRATVQELEASIEEIDVTLRKSVLKAPFNGIVSKRHLDEGTVIQAGQSVMRLVENAVPEARIGLPVEMTKQLEMGSSQTVIIDSRTYSTTVRAILPEVDPETRTQIVILELDQTAIGQTHPGQTVRLTRTKTIDSDGYWLPLSALTKGIRGLWTAYIVVESSDGNGWEVQQQAVEVLHQDENRAYVRGTLQPSDRVVAKGTHRLVPGQTVSVSSDPITNNE